MSPLRVMHDCYTDAGCEGRHEELIEMCKAIGFFSFCVRLCFGWTIVWSTLLISAGLNLSFGAESLSKSMIFQDDIDFLKDFTNVILLRKGLAAVAVAPAYQGRVMTSTYEEETGPSFGWINRSVISQGIRPELERKGTLQEHIHVFGGEERFWMGPEGGQYALFFEPGARFDFSDWKTPAAIDTDSYQVVAQQEDSVSFHHLCNFQNYSGTQFHVGIDRTVSMLEEKDLEMILEQDVPQGLYFVGYKTVNRVTNRGKDPWVPQTGLLSIWILGMYNPSPRTTVVIPLQKGKNMDLRNRVNDEYFGPVPNNFLCVRDDTVFFRGDGSRRGKIGVDAKFSRGVLGSYDAVGKVLTLVTYNVQESPFGYVNSMWNLQDEPYVGDVINAYNDGPSEQGGAPLGPFYELETSSPAAALGPNEAMQHVQQTWHIKGPDEQLKVVAKRLLGVDLSDIEKGFVRE